MLRFFLSTFYVLLPMYVANMAPVIAKKLSWLPLGTPISKHWFGAHKTYKGFYTAYIAALVMLWIQRLLQKNGIFESIRLIDYQVDNIWFIAVLMGIGAMLGDTVKSFFKRRLGFKEGSAWIPFDQLDFLLGALLCLVPFYTLPLPVVLIAFPLTLVLHMLTNVVGYALGYKEVWW